jgi:hypothetical protein
MNGPYPIITLPAHARDLSEPMGTKEKFWFEHTVERVRAILDQTAISPPSGWTPVVGIASANDIFAGYLMLDALVGNTDRHHENWAVVLSMPRSMEDAAANGRRVELAPTFDHASCLGFNLRDEERIDRMTPAARDFADALLRVNKARILGLEHS